MKWTDLPQKTLKIIGKMSLNRLILILALMLCQFSYAQSDSLKYPKVIIFDGDTVTVFSMEQSLELAKRNEQLKECNTLYTISESQISKQNTIVKTQKEKISNLEQIVKDYKDISNAKDDKLDICELEKSDLKEEVERQKKHKIIAIISGGVIAILGILF